MRTIEKVKQITIVEKTKDIICNKCKKSCKSGMAGSTPEYDGLLEATITGGYFSKLGDGTTYEFSLCEECLGKLFQSFEIPPVSRYEGRNDDDFNSDDIILEYELTDQCLKIIEKDKNFKEFNEKYIYLCSVHGYCFVYPSNTDTDLSGFLEFLISNNVDTSFIKVL